MCVCVVNLQKESSCGPAYPRESLILRETCRILKKNVSLEIGLLFDKPSHIFIYFFKISFNIKSFLGLGCNYTNFVKSLHA